MSGDAAGESGFYSRLHCRNVRLFIIYQLRKMSPDPPMRALFSNQKEDFEPVPTQICSQRVKVFILNYIQTIYENNNKTSVIIAINFLQDARKAIDIASVCMLTRFVQLVQVTRMYRNHHFRGVSSYFASSCCWCKLLAPNKGVSSQTCVT